MPDSTSANTADIVKSLDNFSNNIRIKVTRLATRRAAKHVHRAMVDLVPYRTGALRESIKTKIKVDKAGGRAYSVTGPFGKVNATINGVNKKRSQLYKARFIEYGTKNMSANPFIAQSLEKTRTKVEREFESAVEKQLKKL